MVVKDLSIYFNLGQITCLSLGSVVEDVGDVLFAQDTNTTKRANGKYSTFLEEIQK
eukprot:Pgem_evm1s18042